MLGILVQLAVSWLLLFLLYRKDLRALGLAPTRLRLFDLGAGLLLGGLCAAAYTSLVFALTDTRWTVNPAFTARQALESAGWVLRSVVFEELIFRGALLYIALRVLRLRWACLLSAAAFGIYHWFSYGALGNPVMMAYVFVTTGVVGLVWAAAFARTGSMYLPTALHFGVNLATTVVFSQGPLGPQLLTHTVEDSQRLGTAASLLTTLFHLVLQAGTVLLYLRYRPAADRPDWEPAQEANP